MTNPDSYKDYPLAKVFHRKVTLTELRGLKKLTQVQIASTMKISQANLSKMENRDDMHISTLRNYIDAMGGELTIIAEFPERDVELIQFKKTK
jgi:transcriptional regulator with XRE-family HTH domain